MPQYIIMIETDAPASVVHEQLCLAAHEGETLTSLDIKDVQFVGHLEDAIAQEDATDEQLEAVEGAVLSADNKLNQEQHAMAAIPGHIHMTEIDLETLQEEIMELITNSEAFQTACTWEVQQRFPNNPELWEHDEIKCMVSLLIMDKILKSVV
jgi:hypothetical protein